MTLTGKMVELIWFSFGKNSAKRSIIIKICIVEKQFLSVKLRILDEMLDPPAVKRTGTTYNSMHLIITFFQKQLSEIRTVLASNPCDEGFFQMLLNMSDLLKLIVRFRSDR